MTVRIRLFAIMAQHAHTGTLTLELAEGARLSTVRGELERRFEKIPWPAGTMLAVNQEYASPEHLLHPGDEIAVIPPVSGG